MGIVLARLNTDITSALDTFLIQFAPAQVRIKHKCAWGQQILLKKFKEALESNDMELFEEAIIHDLGQLPGTPEYRDSLKIWHARHGRS